MVIARRQGRRKKAASQLVELSGVSDGDCTSTGVASRLKMGTVSLEEGGQQNLGLKFDRCPALPLSNILILRDIDTTRPAR